MEVLEVRVFPVENAKSLKARANVTLGEDGLEVSIKGFRLFAPEGKKPWVGVPQERYSLNGETKFKETLWMNKTAESKIYPLVIEEYRKKIKS